MILRALVETWRAHQGGVAMLIGLMVMAIAWVRVLLGYRSPTTYRAPSRWYMGYSPPPFIDPAKWDLRELNALYRTHAGRREDSADDAPPERE